MSAVGMYLIVMFPFLVWSCIWWCLMSMNFLRFVRAKCLGTLIAAWLLTINGVGFVSGCLISSNMRLIH